MKVRIYVEGGGEGKHLPPRCREAFQCFFASAGLGGRMPKCIPCGRRGEAYRDFCIAVAHPQADTVPMLLVDSECAITEASGWEHLRARDGWDRPGGARDEQAHLMVECMEAWFLADREQLAGYFGQGFAESALPANANPEAVAKSDLLESLKSATRNCKTKARYDKGKHSFEILGKLNAQAVGRACAHAKRLLDVLRQTL